MRPLSIHLGITVLFVALPATSNAATQDFEVFWDTFDGGPFPPVLFLTGIETLWGGTDT